MWPKIKNLIDEKVNKKLIGTSFDFSVFSSSILEPNLLKILNVSFEFQNKFPKKIEVTWTLASVKSILIAISSRV